MEILGIGIPFITPILVTALLGVLTYMYLTWGLNFWKRRGIPGPPPKMFAGTMYNLGKGLKRMDLDYIKEYGPVIGEFFGGTPSLLVTDPAMIKRIMVKDFSHFTDRSSGPKKLSKGEYIFRKMLTTLEGEEWKRVRNTLTPAFSASKLKVMIPHINECANKLVENLKIKNTEEIEMKNITDSYTFDVIARVGFGVDLDAQKEPNDPFVLQGRNLIRGGSSTNKFRRLTMMYTPSLFRFLRLFFPEDFSLFNKEGRRYFIDLIGKIIKERKGATKGGEDLIQMMLKAHTMVQREDEMDTEIGGLLDAKDKTPKKGLSDEEVLASSFLLMFAGFETTSSTLGLVMYYLALNPKCLKKAQAEVDEVMQGKEMVTYEMANQQFPYLEMCIHETLRIHPFAGRTDRHCCKDITINGVKFTKGMTVGISIVALHYNPEVWPEPETFKPERFTPEAKADRDPVNYMPFSYGPRNCIGIRLAQLELRIALIKILRVFNISPCANTQIPLELAPAMVLRPKKGIFLKLEPRQR